MTRALPALLLLSAVPAAAVGAEVELGYRHEALTRGADWKEVSLDGAWRPAERTGLELGARWLERFGLEDLDLRAAANRRLTAAWTLSAEASASPGHRVVPALTGGASLQRVLGGGFVGSGGARWSRWETDAGASDVVLGSLGLEMYWRTFRVGWTGTLARVADSWAPSNALAWDVYLGERDRLGVVLAAGREVEATGGPAPVVSTVLAAALRGRRGLGADWAVVAEVGVQRQGDLYTRGGARIGLRRSF